MYYTRFLIDWTGRPRFFIFFFFNDTATTEIYTLSLHDALPIWMESGETVDEALCREVREETGLEVNIERLVGVRSEEHTSELQSRSDIVCRLLLEKKKKTKATSSNTLRYKMISLASCSAD